MTFEENEADREPPEQHGRLFYCHKKAHKAHKMKTREKEKEENKRRQKN